MYPPEPTNIRADLLRNEYKRKLILNWDGFIIPYFDNRGQFTFLSERGAISSKGNPGWRRLRGNSRGDIGSNFFLEKLRLNSLMEPQAVKDERPGPYPGSVWIYEANGTILPCPPSQLEYPPPMNSGKNQMDMWGAEAVAKSAPGASPMNLAAALAELKKDGIPSIVGASLKDRTLTAKKAGDEYLNAQFGWKPLVSDVKSLANTISNADDILNQLERDAGQVVRRRITLEDGWSDYSLENLGDANPTIGGTSDSQFGLLYPQGQLLRSSRTYRKVWFSGAFTYYLPPDYYSRNQIRSGAARTRVLYGLNLNPSTLWQIAPWSWAVDWFSNADEVISNATRFLSEGLVMHHGYIMEHTIHEYLYTYRGDAKDVPGITLITETKSRLKANPFGFGIDWPDLSAFQLSILGALGLSKRG